MVQEKELPVYVIIIITFVIILAVVWTVFKIYLECCYEEETETTNPETITFTGTNNQNIRIEIDEPTQEMFQNFFTQFNDSSRTSQSHSNGNTQTFQTSTTFVSSPRSTTSQPSAPQPSAARSSSPRPTAPPKNQTMDNDDLPSYNDVMDGLYGHKK
ncbi:hypothetical protein ACKWTF_014204 [Chironomus riparius]